MYRKPLFDAVRKLLGRAFRQSEVDALDAAIEAMDNSPPDRCQVLHRVVSATSVSSLSANSKAARACERTGWSKHIPTPVLAARPGPSAGGRRGLA